jgi:hypothetical protein
MSKILLTKKLFACLSIFLLISLITIGQGSLPLIRVNSKQVKIRDGEIFKENFWVISPEVKPEIYFVDFPRKEHEVTFITDKNSIAFQVKFGNHYDFIILLNGKDSCYTRISATHPKAVIAIGAVPTDSIPFTIIDNRVYVKGKINDSEDLLFQFDLGAGGIGMAFINHKSVKKVKLNFEKITTLGNSDGTNQARLSNNNTLRIGNSEWLDIEIVETKNMNRYEDDIFGNGLFLDKYVDVNYEKRMLIIHDKLPAMGEGYKKYPIRFNQNVYPEVEATFELEGKKYNGWFTFDTGMTGNGIVNSNFLKKHGLYSKFSKIMVIGKRAIAKIPLIHFADQMFSDGLIVLERNNKASGAGYNGGVLGNKLLKRFDFILDSQQGFIYLKPHHF